MKRFACIMLVLISMCLVNGSLADGNQRTYDRDQLLLYLEIREDALFMRDVHSIIPANTEVKMEDFLKEFPTNTVRSYFEPYDQLNPSQYAVYQLDGEMKIIVISCVEDKGMIGGIMPLGPLCERSFFLKNIKRGISISAVQAIDPNMIANPCLSSRYLSNHLMSDGSYFEVLYDTDDIGNAFVKSYREIQQNECLTLYKSLRTTDLTFSE